MDYMTLKEAAEKWGVTPRRVNYYCAGGRIPGAVKMAGVWLLPKTAEKPLDGRTKQGKELRHEELADLQVSFPAVWEQYIEKLSEYMASTGKRYQSHAATIRRWAGEDAKKTVTPSRNRDYSVKEDETV